MCEQRGRDQINTNRNSCCARKPRPTSRHIMPSRCKGFANNDISAYAFSVTRGIYMETGVISRFLETHYKHFNSRVLVAAAQSWKELVKQNGQIVVAMAGAMSTAELGIILSKVIKNGDVTAICCTAANIEEELMRLIGQDKYLAVDSYSELTPSDEENLKAEGYNRVTDVCIPESVMERLSGLMLRQWQCDEANNVRRHLYEYFFRVLDLVEVVDMFVVAQSDSWLCAAKEKGIPIYTPGWEDSTLGNFYAASIINKKIVSLDIVKNGIDQMICYSKWYKERSDAKIPLGMFQIGGGISGDFCVSVVPMLLQDCKQDVNLWSYFCQVSDSTTSYGSYSGAPPNEKITWSKLAADTPRYMINSDATIVAPLIFAYVLGL